MADNHGAQKINPELAQHLAGAMDMTPMPERARSARVAATTRPDVRTSNWKIRTPATARLTFEDRRVRRSLRIGARIIRRAVQFEVGGTVTPFFQMRTMFRVARISVDGSPSTSSRSARRPGAIRPRSVR